MIKVGDRFETTKGGECVVIQYDNTRKVKVKFLDNTGHEKWTTSKDIATGWIKNPYAPCVFDVGYFGVGPYKSKGGSTRDGFSNLPAYSAWMNMLSRCYDDNYVDSHLYENSTVCNEWHNFQVFAEWYTSELSYTGWEGRTCLDKDVMGSGFSYSPESCCLIPASMNRGIAAIRGGKYLPGVTKSTNGYYGVVSGYALPRTRFNTELEAHMYFVKAKAEKISVLADKYKNWLNPKVYEALRTKDFRYKFSPYFENTHLILNSKSDWGIENQVVTETYDLNLI